MQPNSLEIDFEVRTQAGFVIRTFSDQGLATSWWENESFKFPGCFLERVERELRETRRTVRRPHVQIVREA